MIAYWERDCEWMGEGLQLAICPSFTGPTGLAALDVSGRSNPGVLTNMDRNTAWVTSGGKGALSFSTDDFVNFGNPPVVTSGLPFFVSAWFRTTSASVQVIVAKSRAATATHRLWLTVGEGSGDARVNGTDAAGGGVSATFTTPWSDGNWHQIAGLYFGSTMSLFYDGQFRASAAILQLDSSANILVAGKYNDASGGVTGNTAPFNGQLDDLRIYNRALTAPEIRQLYERDRGGGMLHQPVNQRSYYAQLAAAFSILAESGSYALNGHPVPLLYGRALPADTGSVLLSGQATPLLTSRLLSADQGSYAYAGTDAATLLGRLLDAGAAAYTLDGTAAGFLAGRRISADTVAYLASGLDAGFLRSRVLEAGTGQYVLVASPVNLQTGTPGTGGAAPYYYMFLLGGSR